MKTTELLIEAAGAVWDRCYDHPFVQGIQSGALDREKFRYYIMQDYLYLKDYAKVFALGAAKARDVETASLLAGYLSVMNGEMNVHSGYLARLGVTQAELDTMPPALDNRSYTSYMLRVAYEAGAAEILAAVLPCAVSYEVLAKRIVENAPDSVGDAFYGDWIRGYASEEYAAGNAELLRALDRLTAQSAPEQLARLRDIFVTCSRYELAFWELAWKRAQ